MGLAARFHSLVPDLSHTLLRFPVPALASALLCLWWIVEGVGSDSAGSVIAGGAAAFIAAGAAHLFAEGRNWPAIHGVLLALAAALALACVGYFTSVFATNHLFLFLGLIPLLMVAGHLRADTSQGALWLFNARLWLAAFLAVVVGLLLAAGLTAIVGALDFLFGVDPPAKLYERIWGLAVSLVAPLYGLSLVPRHLDEEIDMGREKGSLHERGVSVLVNYVLVPVALIYALILHAFAAKIALVGELPRDQVATMVAIYAGGGTAVWLVGWPWREQGALPLRLFNRGWFYLTPVPTLLLALAIGRRLSDYGVTPDRYGIVIVALWMGFVTLYLAWRRNLADMRAVIAAIGLLLLVGALGPFGANGLTVASQYQRLTALLADNGLLVDGKAKPAAALLPAELGASGYSMLEAIRAAGGLERLKPLFAGARDDPFAAHSDQWNRMTAIAAFMGLTAGPVNADFVSFAANTPAAIEIAAGRLVGPFVAYQRNDMATPQPMTAAIAGEKLVIWLENDVLEVELEGLLTELRAGMTANVASQKPIAVTIAPGVRLVMVSFYGNPTATPRLTSASFWLILPPPAPADQATP